MWAAREGGAGKVRGSNQAWAPGVLKVYQANRRGGIEATHRKLVEQAVLLVLQLECSSP